MFGLSLSWFRRAPVPAEHTEPVTPILSAFDAVKKLWEGERTAANLEQYLKHQTDAHERTHAVFQFLFLGGAGEAANHWETMPGFMLGQMREAEATVRLLLPPDRYDWAFRQNIAVWYGITDGHGFHAPTNICINRMAAVESVFSDRISDEIVEVGVAFLIRLLIAQGDKIGNGSMGDPLMRRCFEVAQQFAKRRPSGSLTREEMAQLRDAALFARTEFSHFVQWHIARS